MSTDYVPRHGDRIRVEMTVVPAGKQDTQNAALADWLVAQLAAEGRVELVARAEPDWRDGDIGQHVETGERFLYRPYYGRVNGMDASAWMAISSRRGLDVAFRTAEELAGKLVRCTVTPEDDWPWPPSLCAAHGNQRCGACHRNPSTCNTAGVDPGCGVYAETGMHWDTCPNRVR